MIYFTKFKLIQPTFSYLKFCFISSSENKNNLNDNNYISTDIFLIIKIIYLNHLCFVLPRLDSSRRWDRMIVYRSMAQTPSNPLNIIKNHPKTFPAVGLTNVINGPNNHPRPCVTQDDNTTRTHRFIRSYD
jgi:hypothetical protein